MSKDIDVPQRIEELELSLADLFDSVKAPNVSSIDEGERQYLRVSWVSATHGDTTLDERCAVTVRFDRAQLTHYTHMPPQARERFRARLGAAVLDSFHDVHQHEHGDDCSADYVVADALFRLQ